MHTFLSFVPLLVQDEAEADGGGLRVPEALLRDPDGGEPAAAQGGAGAPRAQARLAAPLHAHVPAHHPHRVPLLPACLLLLVVQQRNSTVAVADRNSVL